MKHTGKQSEVKLWSKQAIKAISKQQKSREKAELKTRITVTETKAWQWQVNAH